MLSLLLWPVLESALMLELTDKLECRVEQSDISEPKKYLEKVRELFLSGSLRFDTGWIR